MDWDGVCIGWDCALCAVEEYMRWVMLAFFCECVEEGREGGGGSVGVSSALYLP